MKEKAKLSAAIDQGQVVPPGVEEPAIGGSSPDAAEGR